MDIADRRAQRLAVRIRIALGGCGLCAGGQRRRAAPQWVLVGGELDQRLAVRTGALAGDIGVDRGDPWLGLRRA